MRTETQLSRTLKGNLKVARAELGQKHPLWDTLGDAIACMARGDMSGTLELIDGVDVVSGVADSIRFALGMEPAPPPRPAPEPDPPAKATAEVEGKSRRRSRTPRLRKDESK